jgi:phosphoadenosine phosphosulfate reductase
MGQDKFILSPIIDWTTSEVWTFVRNNIGYYCKLYDEGFTRIGCVFCPNAPPKVKQLQLRRFPRFRLLYEKAIQKCIEYGNYTEFESASDVFDWWISGVPQKTYLAMKKQGKLGF